MLVHWRAAVTPVPPLTVLVGSGSSISPGRYLKELLEALLASWPASHCSLESAHILFGCLICNGRKAAVILDDAPLAAWCPVVVSLWEAWEHQ